MISCLESILQYLNAYLPPTGIHQLEILRGWQESRVKHMEAENFCRFLNSEDFRGKGGKGG